MLIVWSSVYAVYLLIFAVEGTCFHSVVLHHLLQNYQVALHLRQTSRFALPSLHPERGGPHPQVVIESVLVVNLAPQASLGSQNFRWIHSRNLDMQVGIDLLPCDVFAELVTPNKSLSLIEVEHISLRKDNFAGSGVYEHWNLGRSSPKLHYFILFRCYFCAISPKNRLHSLIQLGLEMGSPIHLQLAVVLDSFLLHELFNIRSQVPARAKYLISP